ncbi:hypothetical protein TYRP_015727 [Tyrophagus putrescentiae]|nr:hypothetical protein TYRP_015727 [Tyrophagus putrescentiae]
MFNCIAKVAATRPLMTWLCSREVRNLFMLSLTYETKTKFAGKRLSSHEMSLKRDYNCPNSPGRLKIGS